MRPHLAITMGDPAGVGPEIIIKACERLRPRLEAGLLRLLVIGSCPALRAACGQLGVGTEIPEVAEESDWPALACLQAAPEGEPILPGVLSAEGGRFASAAIERGVRLAHGNMRVSHVSTHVALEDVPKRLTPERLRLVIDLTHEALRDLGLERARIAVAALNPHAGEGGLFGRQDIDVSQPTIERACADGLDVVGPVPGDTVFVKLRAGQYDAVIAMYHDQGHIPVKLLGFNVDPATGRWEALSGVNVTLGLPIIRTSVDHGTAFDIAGKGIANELSLIEAIELAEQLAAARLARA